MSMPKDFWRLWQGSLVSHLGTQAFNVMALYWLAQHTGGAGAGAAFLALTLLPPALFGPSLVRWAQQWSPKRILVVSDLFSAVLTVPLVIGCLGGLSDSVVLMLLLSSAAMLALVNALAMPSLHAAVPALVPEERLATANGWMMATPQLASVAGQAVGGLVYALLGPALLCIGNFVSFLGSAAMAARIETFALRKPAPAAASTSSGWMLLSKYPAMRELAWLSGLFNAFYAPWLVLLPFQLKEVAGTQAAGFGLALSVYAMGNVTGAALARRLLQAAGPKMLRYAFTAQACSLVLLGLASSLWQILGVLVCMGAGIGLANVLSMTRAQQLAPPGERAMTVAVLRSTVYLATPIGYGIVAVAQQWLHIPPATLYLASGGLLALVMVPYLMAARSS
jgi:MFS transporter, DHA3 family, macrolide efflux protein